MAVEPSHGVEIIQWPPIWRGQTEQTARAMQQQCKLAWLPFDDQQPIRDLRLLMSPVSGVRGGEAAPHPQSNSYLIESRLMIRPSSRLLNTSAFKCAVPISGMSGGVVLSLREQVMAAA